MYTVSSIGIAHPRRKTQSVMAPMDAVIRNKPQSYVSSAGYSLLEPWQLVTLPFSASCPVKKIQASVEVG